MPETITFELIRKIQREEQSSSKLSKLPERFFENAKNYLKQKREIAEKERKVGLEVKNAERLLEDIFNRRERKILNSAINSVRTNIPPENLTQEEKDFFEKIFNFLKERRKETLEKLLEEDLEKKVSMIVFLEDVPQFVGSDERVYGPFKKGDIAKLPEENTRILIERKIAEEFKIKV